VLELHRDRFRVNILLRTATECITEEPGFSTSTMAEGTKGHAARYLVA